MRRFRRLPTVVTTLPSTGDSHDIHRPKAPIVTVATVPRGCAASRRCRYGCHRERLRERAALEHLASDPPVGRGSMGRGRDRGALRLQCDGARLQCGRWALNGAAMPLQRRTLSVRRDPPGSFELEDVVLRLGPLHALLEVLLPDPRPWPVVPVGNAVFDDLARCHGL